MKRLVVSGYVPDGGRVEDNNVSHHPRPQNAPIRNPHAAGSLRAHLADGFFQAHGVLCSNVLSQDARKGPEGPGVCFGGAQRPVFRLRRRI